MTIYSNSPILNDFTIKAYAALLENKIEVLSDSFKEISFGVTFKAIEHNKEISIAIYHSDKKGFSVLSKSEKIQQIIHSLLFCEDMAGSDEAGKGDVFGPLVVSSFYLGGESKKLLRLGIKDSKNMKNDDILRFYKEAVMEFGSSFATIKIMPERYNSLYSEFKQRGQNLNNMMAWAHGKALFNLYQKKPEIKKVVVDQFSADEHIKNNIRKMIPSTEIIFETKGERHLAVAAASIMARGEYLYSLSQISAEVLENKVSLLSGSGEPSDKLLGYIIKEFGYDILPKICKTHFANIQKLRQTTI